MKILITSLLRHLGPTLAVLMASDDTKAQVTAAAASLVAFLWSAVETKIKQAREDNGVKNFR